LTVRWIPTWRIPRGCLQNVGQRFDAVVSACPDAWALGEHSALTFAQLGAASRQCASRLVRAAERHAHHGPIATLLPHDAEALLVIL
jgi:hypothetical protein